MPGPEIKVISPTCWQPVNVDDDGIPLAGGERMTEIEPGVWAHPALAEALDFLEKVIIRPAGPMARRRTADR